MEAPAVLLGILIFMALLLFALLLYYVVNIVKERRADRTELLAHIVRLRAFSESKDAFIKDIVNHYTTQVDEERKRFIALFIEKTGEKLQQDIKTTVQREAFRVLNAYGTPPLKENDK